jgi:hypothetical protein
MGAAFGLTAQRRVRPEVRGPERCRRSLPVDRRDPRAGRNAPREAIEGESAFLVRVLEKDFEHFGCYAGLR